jgi:hypothetical protein
MVSSLFIVVSVVLCAAVHPVGSAMPAVAGGLFPFFFSILLVSLYLFNYICNFQTFSDV